MLIVDVIRAKRDGQEIAPQDLRDLIAQYTQGDVPDYQIAAFLMAVFFRGMSGQELAAWTDAMLRSGEVLDLSDIPGLKVDKHSTGGVGDKVSLILAPLAVAAGLKVPMISGRGLGHTGGTLDKLESIPGFNVNQPVERFRELVRDLGCGLIGQTGEIAPADKKLYALRDVTATVECIPLIASSIMSKKLAEGIDALVLDVKVGSGAFMKDLDSARELATTMIDIGTRMKCRTSALITDMSQPLGHAIGNALEVIECVEVMQGAGPQDLIDLTVAQVAEMLRLADKPADEQELRAMLRDGRALSAFRAIVEAQGGDPRVCDDPHAVLPKAKHQTTFAAPSAGVIMAMDTQQLGLASLELGAGRKKKEDDVNHAVGLVMQARLGDQVEAGQPLLTIHYDDPATLAVCEARLAKSFTIEAGATHTPIALILARC